MNIGIVANRLNEAFVFLKSKGQISTQKEIADAIGSNPTNVSRAFKGDERYLTQKFLVRFNHAFGDVFNQDWLEGTEDLKKFRDKIDTKIIPCYYNSSARIFHANGDDWPSQNQEWHKICDASFVKWDTFRAAIYNIVKDPRIDASNQLVKELWVDYNFNYDNGNDSEWEPPEKILKNFRNKGSLRLDNVEMTADDYVPLLPIEAMAGSLQGFSDGVELRNCRKIKCPVRGADWAIQISGDSMEPEYKNGTYLYIKKMTGAFIPWGHTMVVDTLDGVVVKNIFPFGDSDEYIEARSFNPKYPPFKIETSCILGIYRVLGGSFF